MGKLGDAMRGMAVNGLMKFSNKLVDSAMLMAGRPQAMGSYLDSIDGRLQRNQGGGRLVISTKTLYQMAHVDPVTFSIINRFKTRITKMDWNIGPDNKDQAQELQAWERLAAAALSPYAPAGYKAHYEAVTLPEEVAGPLSTALEGLDPKDPDARKKARWLFDEATAAINSAKSFDAAKATDFLKNCNQDSPTPFKDWLEATVDDLCMYDAGGTIKRKTRGGAPLEMYAIDGSQVVRYRNLDYSTPQPPYRAYAWEVAGRKVADFTTDEMLYMMANPQHQGYGFSPLEAAVHIIMGSLYAETYNLDAFRSQIPPAVMNLGPVNDNQRIRFRTEWQNEVMGRGGVHRLMFINVDTKDGKMKPELIPMDNLTQKEMEFMKYLNWTLSIKCMCYQISPQDIGFVQDFHRTTANVQKGISAEGIQDMASLIEGYVTRDILQNFMGLQGIAFRFEREESGMDLEKARVYDMFLGKGALSRNEVREVLGLRPMAEGGDEYTIITAQGPVPIEQADANADLEATPEGGKGEPTPEEQDAQDAADAAAQDEQDAADKVSKLLRKIRGTGENARQAHKAAMREAKKNRKGLVDRFSAALKTDAEKRAKKASAAIRATIANGPELGDK